MRETFSFAHLTDLVNSFLTVCRTAVQFVPHSARSILYLLKCGTTSVLTTGLVSSRPNLVFEFDHVLMHNAFCFNVRLQNRSERKDDEKQDSGHKSNNALCNLELVARHKIYRIRITHFCPQ